MAFHKAKNCENIYTRKFPMKVNMLIFTRWSCAVENIVSKEPGSLMSRVFHIPPADLLPFAGTPGTLQEIVHVCDR